MKFGSAGKAHGARAAHVFRFSNFADAITNFLRKRVNRQTGGTGTVARSHCLDRNVYPSLSPTTPASPLGAKVLNVDQLVGESSQYGDLSGCFTCWWSGEAMVERRPIKTGRLDTESTYVLPSLIVACRMPHTTVKRPMR